MLISGYMFSDLDYSFCLEYTGGTAYLKSHYYITDAATSGNRSLLYLLFFFFSLCPVYFYISFCLSRSDISLISG